MAATWRFEDRSPFTRSGRSQTYQELGMLRLWGAHNRVIGRSRTGELALFCSSLQIINQRICGLWRRETSIGHNDLMPVKRVDDGAPGNVAAVALSRDIGKRSLELLQVNNLLPNAR